ncbi:hypothetical protein NDU88_000960 [Pleurodeles waltl]|uniref:Uncharacterized protein n=1 Tax=Pleurodeles waltl TaxID=8319 RepID=A0AAV7TIS1_PLEWA|nr:hypothetical protein NDU88_000960 [Pleurodeles waltl]
MASTGLSVDYAASATPRGHSRPSPSVRPDRGVFPGAAAVRGGPVQIGDSERVAPSLSVQLLVIRSCRYLQNGLVPSRCLRRTPWTPSIPLSSLMTPGSPSPQPPLRRSSPGQRGLPWVQRSLSAPPSSRRTAAATPLFQFGRTGRDRRSGPGSAAGVSPSRHFVFRDGSGAARERDRFHEGAHRRRFPGVQGSQGPLRRRLQLGQATLTTGG